MNDNHRQPHTDVTLTAEERADMKRDFMSFMEEHPPAQKHVAIPSPYMNPLFRVPAFMLAVIVVMSGTAFAAEESLPNDILYPIKTAVIEPFFIEASARTPLSRAEASHKLIERRLQEAAELIEQNELDTETAAVIVAAVDEHTNDVQAYIASATDSGALDDALDVGSDLENVFEAHGEVLETVAAQEAANETVDALLHTIDDQAEEAEQAAEDLEDRAIISVTPTEVYTTAAEALEAINRLRSTQAAITVTDALTANAAALLEQADSAYAAGMNYAGDEEWSSALPQVRDALQFAEQGVIILESHEELAGE